MIVHGVFLDVAGLGLLITGKSGIGKSELALELITRGHSLIADDAPVFSQVSPGVVSGESPELLQGFLEVRGLGVLNMRALFGKHVIKSQKKLDMIVRLVSSEGVMDEAESRLECKVVEREILGASIPEMTFSIKPGRNMALLIEVAAKNQVLKSNGYDAVVDFQTHLHEQIAED